MQMTHGLTLLQLMVFLACFLKSFCLLYISEQNIFLIFLVCILGRTSHATAGTLVCCVPFRLQTQEENGEIFPALFQTWTCVLKG